MFHDLLQFSKNEIYSFTIIGLIVFIYLLYTLFYQKRSHREICYDNLDVLKFIASILIVIFHINVYMNFVYRFDFVISSIITRLAVPFFFTIAGYLLAQNENKAPDYVKNYLKNLFKTYLVWSLIYLPWGIQYILEMNLDWYLFPVALFLGITYIGIYYHLWYFPALYFSIRILYFWKKRKSLISLLIISFILLVIGSVESYFGYLSTFWQNILHTYYFSIFYTTRNFLFFGLFYVTLGYFIRKKQFIWKNTYNYALIIVFLIFTIDSMISQISKGIDRNILISAPFLVFFLFLRIIYSLESFQHIDKRKLRLLSKYYFFTHPIALEILFYFKTSYPVIVIIILALMLTHLLALLCISLKKHFPRLPI